eukprot:1635657-Pleurochrysis_carterae.AAC.1
MHAGVYASTRARTHASTTRMRTCARTYTHSRTHSRRAHAHAHTIGCIRSAAIFYVVTVSTSVKTIVYMGLRAILGVSSLHYRSGRIVVFGWTMMYKRGHPVATLPSDGGDYKKTSLSRNDVNSANQQVVTVAWWWRLILSTVFELRGTSTQNVLYALIARMVY